MAKVNSIELKVLYDWANDPDDYLILSTIIPKQEDTMCTLTMSNIASKTDNVSIVLNHHKELSNIVMDFNERVKAIETSFNNGKLMRNG